MLRGGNLLDSIQSGGQTINTLIRLMQIPFRGYLQALFIPIIRIEDNKIQNFLTKTEMVTIILTTTEDLFVVEIMLVFLPMLEAKAGTLVEEHNKVGSYRQPIQRGSYSNFPSKQRGQQFQSGRENPVVAARQRQQGYYPANERRPRSPGPRISRSPINNGDKRDKRRDNLPRSRSNSQGKSKTGCLR